MMKKILEKLPRYTLTVVSIAIVLYFTLFPRPFGNVRIPLFPGADKVVHFLLFFALGFSWLFDFRKRSRRSVAGCFLSGVALGGLTELLQWGFVDGRSGDWLDFLADAAGVGLGMALCGFVFTPEGHKKTVPVGVALTKEEQSAATEKQKPKKRSWLRNAFLTVAAVFVLILLLPSILYIPAVQNYAKNLVTEMVVESTGYQVNVGRLSLKFPFRLSVDDVAVLDEQRDTLVSGGNISLNVSFLPLLQGELSLDGLSVNQATYRMVSADSSLVMDARLGHFGLQGGSVDLLTSRVSLGEASVAGVDVVLALDSCRSAVEPPDSSVPMDWLLSLRKLSLRNVRYRMAMMPVIDSLDVRLPQAEIAGASLNFKNSLIRVRKVDVSGLDAVYLQPDSVAAAKFLAEMPAAIDTLEVESSRPWSVLVEDLCLDEGEALYATKGVTPAEGLDASYLSLNGIKIEIKDFYNRGTTVRVPISHISARERSGLELKKIEGTFEMDERSLAVRQMRLATASTTAELDAFVDMSAFSNNPDAAIELLFRSEIGLSDAELVLPFLRPLWGDLGSRSATLEVDVKGTPGQLSLDHFDMSVPHVMKAGIKGSFKNIFDLGKASGRLRLDGSLFGGEYLKKALALQDVDIPQLRIAGIADYRRQTLSATMNAVTKNGKLLMDGDWSIGAKGYRGIVNLTDFDVRTVLPAGPMGFIDGQIVAEGKGYDPYRMRANLEADVRTAVYEGVEYRDVHLDGHIDRGDYELSLVSGNEMAQVDLAFKGRIEPDKYRMEIGGSIGNIDLQDMHLTNERLSGGMDIRGKLYADTKKETYAASVRLSKLFVLLPGNTFRTDSIDLGFYSDTVRTHLRLRNNDLLLKAKASAGVMALADSVTHLMGEMDSVVTRQSIDFKKVIAVLPRFDVDMQSGDKNIVQTYLAGTGTPYKRMRLTVASDSTLRLHASVGSLVAGGVVFDEISFGGATVDDLFHYRLGVENTLKNAEYLKSASVQGVVGGNSLTAYLTQVDRFDTTGFSFGVHASVADSIATFVLFPQEPIIAFRDWTMNANNFVSFDLATGKMKADISISSGEKSHIDLYTKKDGQFHNGLNLDLSGIELKDWLVMSPFAPPLEGVLSAQVQVNRNERFMWGNSDISVERLRYGKKPVGNVHLNAKVAMAGQEQLYAYAGMDLDGQRYVTMKGYHRPDTVPEAQNNMTLKIERLPLQVVNAFLPDAAGQLSGKLNGEMALGGSNEQPSLSGFVQFDSASIKMPAFGSVLAFDNRRIPVEEGIVRFDKYRLSGANGKPLTVDGTVQILPFDKIYSDLQVKGKDVQVVSGKKSGRVELYGKGFIDVNASVKGPLDRLDMKASLNLLAGTNLTYVVQTTSVGLAEAVDNDMVKFVNFSDTTKAVADTLLSRPFAMRIKAALMVQPNAMFTVNLSPDGKNKVQIDGEGMLSFSQNYQGDMSLIGRYTIGNGFVRYSPPMMSEKLFHFKEGSTIAWTGEMLNPSLNIQAVQTMKVNVGGGNQGSRVVPFDVTLKVGNTLNSLDVVFDVGTEGDMTIANELSGMSPEQRSAQAMNLLLYNTYTGGGQSSAAISGGLAGNMAFSFLESMVNRWAANNISGIDLSFGIDQYDKTVNGATSTTTSYSYKVSKSVFDDRFKIVVGGNYVSDASAEDNLAQNLLNDISFEYKINKMGTTYVKLFHHKEFESILEGEITETGAGFVWKRKIGAWRDLFRVFRSNDKED